MSFFRNLLVLDSDLSSIISFISFLEELGIIFKANTFNSLDFQGSKFLVKSRDFGLAIVTEFSKSLFIKDELDSFILKDNNTLSEDFIFTMKDSVFLLEVFNIQAFKDDGNLSLGLISVDLDVIEARVEDIFLDEFIAQHGQINRFVDLFIDVKIFISSKVRLGGLELSEDFFDLLDRELGQEEDLVKDSLDLFLSGGLFSIDSFRLLSKESKKDNKSLFNESQSDITVCAEFSGKPVVGNSDLIADCFLRDVFTEVTSDLDKIFFISVDQRLRKLGDLLNRFLDGGVSEDVVGKFEDEVMGFGNFDRNTGLISIVVMLRRSHFEDVRGGCKR